MAKFVVSWCAWSLVFGPATFMVLGFLVFPFAGSSRSFVEFAPLYLFYWGAGTVIVSIALTPAILLLYTGWAWLSRRVAGLDGRIPIWAAVFSVALSAPFALWFESMDSADDGRAFSFGSLVLVSCWLSLALWGGIAGPRLLRRSLSPGCAGSAA